MASNIKGIKIEIDGDTQPLQKALKDVNKAANDATSELKQIDRALKFDPGNVTLLAQKQELLGKQVNNTKEKLETLKRVQNDVEDQFKSGEIGADQYRAFQREIEVTSNVLNGYEKKLENVNQALSGNGQAMESNANSMKSMQSETNNLLKADLLNDFSDKLSNASDKLIEIGQNALEAFREVDEGMDTIVTKTGASGDALNDMSDIAKNLTTTIPTDFETAGSAVGELNTQFGLTGDALSSASEQVIKFAEINGSDVTSSTIAAKQAIEAYGLSTDDLGSVLDTVTYTAQATGVSVDDLMSKAVSGAPQIKALGLSFDEGVTLMGNFEKSGVDSSAALSSLSKAAVNYAKDGKTLQQGLSETVSAIKNSSSETEALTLASEIFGTKAAPRMVDAIKRGAFSMDDLSAAAKNSSGAVSKTFESTLDPIDQFTTAQNTAKLALSDVGDAIAETLAPIMQQLAELLKNLATWFSNLSPSIKQAIVIFGVILIAIGALLPVFLALQAAAFTAGTTIGGLFATFLPIVAIVLGISAVIALLVVGIKELWQNNETFRNIVTSVWETIKGVMISVWESIKSIISTAVNTISQVISNTWNALVVTVQFILNMIYNIVMSIWNSIVSFISGVINSITQTVSNGFNTVHNTISNIMNGILGTVQNVWNSVKSTISNAINSAKDAVSTAINAIKNLMNFSWSLPRPKIPKFNISGGEAPWGFGGKGSLPSISVSWFAKGGVLTKPTAFGMNGNSIMAGGEAGQEAVLPLNKDTLGMIGDRIMSTVTDRIVIQQPQQEATLILNIDGKTFAKLIVPFISDEQAQRLQIIETGGTIL
ncbi:phage tail tape measure protein [Streptococcus uberis]|uniref:phage tail tape measure protein n=1 Tax=Streptococcus uberis TaxID=1349 RepID=UPI0022B918BA|nr:phage tail tape measure protein [Streptococcus uberis]MCZ8466393.1 phage tail tape measure protein [Streptococcus uberis]